MRLGSLLAAGLAVALLAGCLQFGPASEDDENDPSVDGGATDAEEATRSWPELSEAQVRPGVGVTSESGSCTSNFVYRSPDNETLYLGLAAHCLPGEEENEGVTIAGSVQASVAYNSWYTMDNMDGDAGVARDTNDFALIEIPEDKRDLVHPALLHYGGPVGLADQGEMGERVLTYGNTPLRQGIEPSNSREGYVVDASSWYTSMYMVTPGLPGDSGSAVVNAQGEALGVLIHLGIAPLPASNGAVNVKPALEFAKEHAGLEVELATWDILDPGVFPDESDGAGVSA